MTNNERATVKNVKFFNYIKSDYCMLVLIFYFHRIICVAIFIITIFTLNITLMSLSKYYNKVRCVWSKRYMSSASNHETMTN